MAAIDAPRDFRLGWTAELIAAAKKAGVQNALFISSVGCDLADPQKQPRLREFIDLEALMLSSKGDPDTPLGHSPCVIRFVRLLLQFAALTTIP